MSYTPKPGDSVKATLGDSVIYGVFQRGYPAGGGSLEAFVAIQSPSLGIYEVPTPENSDWAFEPWVKPVTFKPLTVVRLAVDAPSAIFTVEPYWTDADRQPFNTPVTMYRYDENEWNAINGLVDLSDVDIARALAAEKAEMLFAGVEDDTTGAIK